MARLLKEVVSKAGLSKRLGGRKEHLEYEAWATIARWFNCTPITEWTKPIKDGEKIIGWEARVNVVNEHGRIIGTSEGMCMSDEQNWRGKPTYALRSMSQTRTAGKALRSLFAHIAVLAGYAATPAEEMDGVETKPEAHMQHEPPQAPTTGTTEYITEAQRKRLFAIYKQAGKTDKEVQSYLNYNYGIVTSKEIPKQAYDDICKWAAEQPQREPGDEPE